MATVSCAARPSARPPTDRPASKLVILISRLSAVSTTAAMMMAVLATLLMNGSNCSANARSCGETIFSCQMPSSKSTTFSDT